MFVKDCNISFVKSFFFTQKYSPKGLINIPCITDINSNFNICQAILMVKRQYFV